LHSPGGTEEFHDNPLLFQLALCDCETKRVRNDTNISGREPEVKRSFQSFWLPLNGSIKMDLREIRREVEAWIPSPQDMAQEHCNGPSRLKHQERMNIGKDPLMLIWRAPKTIWTPRNILARS
jgi:hypothetical protein